MRVARACAGDPHSTSLQRLKTAHNTHLQRPPDGAPTKPISWSGKCAESDRRQWTGVLYRQTQLHLLFIPSQAARRSPAFFQRGGYASRSTVFLSRRASPSASRFQPTLR